MGRFWRDYIERRARFEGEVIWLLGFRSLAYAPSFLIFPQGYYADLEPAQLALKHRQNKSQRQRIIVFTCSPIPEDEKTLVKLAKKMKKNGVSIDFVAFGELDDDNTKKLTSFNENVKGGDGSHIAIIPPGPGLLSDQLVTSPILNGDGSAGGVGAGGEGGGGGEGFEFGIDPSVDPELALALRMSMEEEKARVERANKEKAEQEAKEKAAALPEIKEEDEASQPLLNQDGEASAGKEDKKDDDADKMDTA
jgi:26S proteasome regulatory subunit N10